MALHNEAESWGRVKNLSTFTSQNKKCLKISLPLFIMYLGTFFAFPLWCFLIVIGIRGSFVLLLVHCAALTPGGSLLLWVPQIKIGWNIIRYNHIQYTYLHNFIHFESTLYSERQETGGEHSALPFWICWACCFKMDQDQ